MCNVVRRLLSDTYAQIKKRELLSLTRLVLVGIVSNITVQRQEGICFNATYIYSGLWSPYAMTVKIYHQPTV